MALGKGWPDVILYGDEAVVRPLVGQAGIEGRIELRHAADPATALREAVRSVRCGESGVLMKGMLNSSDFLRGVLNKEEGLRTAGGCRTSPPWNCRAITSLFTVPTAG